MVKQISLDTWSVHHLQELLVKATNFISQTNTPIVLYRETLEEKEYPQFYYTAQHAGEPSDSEEESIQDDVTVSPKPNAFEEDTAKEGHLTFEENQKGVTYDDIFGAYLNGAKMIEITDPYIRLFLFRLFGQSVFFHTRQVPKPLRLHIRPLNFHRPGRLLRHHKSSPRLFRRQSHAAQVKSVSGLWGLGVP